MIHKSRQGSLALDQAHPNLILLALWLLVFAASSQIMIVSPILPRIGEALRIPEAIRGTLITAYGVMVGLFALGVGPVSDKVGRRRVLLVGSSTMTLALFLHLFVFDYYSMILARGVAGASGGVLSGGAVAYVGDYFPYEKRGWANGWVMSGMAFGQIIGIPLGTLLANAFGFRAPFLMFAVAMAGAWLLIWLAVPQPEVSRANERLTIRSALRSYRELARRAEIRAVSLTYLLMFLSISLFVIYLPSWLEVELNVPGTAIASLFLVGGLASVMTSPLAGRLSDSVGRKPIIIFSSLGLAVVMLATPLVPMSMLVANILFFASMVLATMRISPIQALLTSMVPASRRGSLMSLATSVGQLGFGLGGVVSGPAYIRWGYGSNTLMAAVCLVAAALLVWKKLPEGEGPSGAARRDLEPAMDELASLDPPEAPPIPEGD